MEKRWKDSALSDIRSHRVCSEYDALTSRAKTKVDALALYKRGVDWCLEHDSPSISLLRKYASDCAFSGIFIDRKFDGELLNDSQVYVFHNCSGIIRVGLNVEKKIIPMLYFANGCNMTISGKSPVGVVVPCYVFGDNEIASDGADAVEIKIYRK